MTKKINVSDLPDFDMAEHLKTDEDVAMYLTTVLEENDPAELTHALGVIARARGMTEVARALVLLVKLFTKPCARLHSRASTRLLVYAPPWASSLSLNQRMPDQALEAVCG